jgi:hypothetical protein
MTEVKKVHRRKEESLGWLKRIGLYLDSRSMHCNSIDSHPWTAKQEVLRRLNHTKPRTDT